MKPKKNDYELVVIGAGMGGLTSAALAAHSGMDVLLLEAAQVVGGCSSSYSKKGAVFETGATTLIGFDEYQPLWWLEKELGIQLKRRELLPSMQVHLDGACITRFKDRSAWIAEAVRVFGQEKAQRRFWVLCFQLSDFVWNAALRNTAFPPREVADWWNMAKSNSPFDVAKLRFLLVSAHQKARSLGISNPDFFRFLDEQLVITAQASSEQTPFLFAAPALTYTNASNFYVDGGLLTMAEQLLACIHQNRGEVCRRQRVTHIVKKDGEFRVHTAKGEELHAPWVISNLPIWNNTDLFPAADFLLKNRSDFGIESQKASSYHKEVAAYKKGVSTHQDAWGAFTMGVVMDDVFSPDEVLHHQFIAKKKAFGESSSIFVSMSHPDDVKRSPAGKRVLNISTHVQPATWFDLGEHYETSKIRLRERILDYLDQHWTPFSKQRIHECFPATPITWQRWVFRHRGRVGGLPQKMNTSLLKWPSVKTGIPGFFQCGDTVFPGQGIPGVTLSGRNAFIQLQACKAKADRAKSFKG